MNALPQVVVRDQTLRRLKSGYPWVVREDLARVKQPDLEAGCLVDFVGKDGLFAARGFFNHRTAIVGRSLTRYNHEEITPHFFKKRLDAALQKRQALYAEPYYRLIHAESDGFPGLIVDRYGDVLVCQINTAGMEKTYGDIEPLLIEALSPRAIVLRNDTPARETEGLSQEIRISYGALDQTPVIINENGVKFQVDVTDGQKTGWFFDQRNNRLDLAALADGKSMIDVFCHTGGFGITAAVKGASNVCFVDSSKTALDQAERNAALNGISDKCSFIEGKAFDVLEQLARDGKVFDVVSVDPPAFIKSRSDYINGLKGYQKLSRLAAPLVAPGGVLFFASCSHHASLKDLIHEVGAGLKKAGRDFTLLKTAGAAPDHPVHPMLTETGYLKALTYRL